jgi:3-oxoacyl-ACP reductase-like protein
MSPNSLANLKPFKRGDEWRGNAGGRPKKLPISEAYAALMPAELDEAVVKSLKLPKRKSKEKWTWAEAITFCQARNACTKTEAAKEIREAIEGKSLTRLRLSMDEDSELNLHVTQERTREETIAEILRIQERIRARSSAQKGELATTRADRLRTSHRANDEE